MLDPDKRYLLSRPRGGFTDAMVQLEKSRLYAQKYGRVLLLDMSKSGLRAQIDALFHLDGDFGCAVKIWHDGMTPALDTARSVLPAALAGRVSQSVTEWNNDTRRFIDKASGAPLDFDHARDHPEHLLVYEQAGGGFAAINALRHLTLRREIAVEILSRVQALGRGYDAVHVRHSDYETDFAHFLRRLRMALRGRRVLVCSDSRAALDAAAEILHPSTTVLHVSDIPDVQGAPLHTSTNINAHAANVDLLSDLVAMALADMFFFTRLSGGNDNGVRYSGFSLLVEVLRRRREVVQDLLALADGDAVEALFAPRSARFDPMHRARLLLTSVRATASTYNAYKRVRKAFREPITADRIAPRFKT